MTSAKVSYIFDPLPPVTVTNQLILFLSSAFWGPPPPSTADVIYGSPLTDLPCLLARSEIQSPIPVPKFPLRLDPLSFIAPFCPTLGLWPDMPSGAIYCTLGLPRASLVGLPRLALGKPRVQKMAPEGMSSQSIRRGGGEATNPNLRNRSLTDCP